jgi:hypothetical protein
LGCGGLLLAAVAAAAVAGGDGGVSDAAPRVSLLERAELAVDRLSGDPARYGAGPGPLTVRFGAASDGLRFYAARPPSDGDVCVIATARAGGDPRGAVCNGPDALRRVGALAFLRPRQSGGTEVGLLVPDGIARVVVGGSSLPVDANMAAVTLAGRAPGTVTLVGANAADVRPDGGPDWPRGAVDGIPSVTVPLSHGSSQSDTPTPLGTLRLVAPDTAPAGTVIPLRVAAPSGLVDRDVIFGVDAVLDRRIGGRWVPSHHLTLAREGGPAPAVPVGTPDFGWVAIGLGGSASFAVWLPSVPPGTYRLRKEVSRPAGDRYASRALTALIRITPDPVLPQAPLEQLAPGSVRFPAAMGPDGTRVWRGPARRSLDPDGRLTCWAFATPGIGGGSECVLRRALARRGGDTSGGGGPWRFAVAAPGATSMRIAGGPVLMVRGVAFFPARRPGPLVEVRFPGGVVKRFR